MKNPKILPFGQWFKVYESAGRNFEKSQRILESRISRGLTRIYEGLGTDVQSSLGTLLSDGAKAALAGVDAVKSKAPAYDASKSFGMADYEGRGKTPSYESSATSMANNVAEQIKGYRSNTATYGKMSVITSTTKEFTLDYVADGKMKVSCDVVMGPVNDKAVSIYEIFNTINARNLDNFLNLIYEDMEAGEMNKWSEKADKLTSYMSWNDDTLYVSGIEGNRITFSSNSTLSRSSDSPSWTGETVTGVSPEKWASDPANSIFKSQGLLYTVKSEEGGAGASIAIADFIKKVSVKTSTDQVQHEGKLENANELFVVGETTYKDPAGGPNKLKAAIQTLFDQFSSIESVTVLGGASNEGPEKLNKQLVDGRAKVIADLIKATWPELAAGTTAVQGDYTKIQPKQQPTSADYRTAYLFIKGTKTSTTTTELPGADLAMSEMKKDKVVVVEHLLTCTVDKSKNTDFQNSKGWKKVKSQISKGG